MTDTDLVPTATTDPLLPLKGANATTFVLADDHMTIRLLLRMLFDGEPDFQVLADAANGIEALQLVRTLRPDVLITDLQMPGQNGLELAARVIEESPVTRVIVLSNFTEEPYLERARALGVHGYIQKSCPVEQLFAAIRKVLVADSFTSVT